jgi:glycosyltransferase involved in cell wall biosynthesis
MNNPILHSPTRLHPKKKRQKITDTQLKRSHLAERVHISLPQLLFISSFPPRQCGIATYTHDLIEALKTHYQSSFLCVHCALESRTEKHTYPAEPQFILNTDKPNAFVKTAFKINRNENIQLIIIQHEFGFYHRHEADLILMLENLNKPIVTVFHTVLPQPSEQQKLHVQHLARLSDSLIVMTHHAKQLLISEYQILSATIAVIPHGTHLIAPVQIEVLKKKHQLPQRLILSTFGLLSSSKSIETTLFALPNILAAIPDTLFLILGKTHPSIIIQEGEVYREYLESIVESLGLEDHVRFVNEYIALPTLLEYLQLSDLYIFTSKDPNQAVSGTLSYAISAGCPVLSTPIPHAVEVITKSPHAFFDFENPKQLATAAIELLSNLSLRQQISQESLTKMASTAWPNAAIKHVHLFQRITHSTLNISFRLPEIILNHFDRLTTGVGMIQFSKIARPDIESGYTIDDNSRALIACVEHYDKFRDNQDLQRMACYLDFIQYCLRSNGSFLNYVNKEKEFTLQNNTDNLDDSNGRAVWALGHLLSFRNILPQKMVEQANILLETAIPFLHLIHSTRAMAFIIKGLYSYNKNESVPLICLFADRLMKMYLHERKNDWHWFEHSYTYGNSLLPEAMLYAFIRTNNNEYREIAEESFDFILSRQFSGPSFRVISNRTWSHMLPSTPELRGGEQPIEVAYTIMALESFYAFYGMDSYKKKADLAFGWFLGNNHLNQIVYNPQTGGCYDGIEEFNINLNQGAESTVCYLLARLSIDRIRNKRINSFSVLCQEV